MKNRALVRPVKQLKPNPTLGLINTLGVSMEGFEDATTLLAKVRPDRKKAEAKAKKEKKR